MNNQIVVVEGVHDKNKVLSVFPNINVITTNGSEISKETLNMIYQSSLNHEVILFLDPDYPGKQIMNKIIETGGNFSIANLNKKLAISKNGRKVGIEHASKEAIYEALNVRKNIIKDNDKIELKNLIERGLAHGEGSSMLRRKLCINLNIPYCNSKTLLRYLNMLDISLERIDGILDGS